MRVSKGLYFNIDQTLDGTLLGEYTIALAYIIAVEAKAVIWFISLRYTPMADIAHPRPIAIRPSGIINKGSSKVCSVKPPCENGARMRQITTLRIE